MALLTTYQDFVGIIELPNTSPTLAGGEVLAFSIAKFEPLYLKTILGYELYELFQANIGAGSGIYHTLREGGQYTDLNGDLGYWNGFNTVGYNPIANFIYFKHQSEQFSNTTGVGERRADAENMSMGNPSYKMVRAWNEMVDYNLQLHDFIISNSDDYPTYIGINERVQGRSFLYGSMLQKKWRAMFTKINPYGI